MLSRHYEAYVLNDEKGEVEKKKVDSLKIGDSLIFLNRDDDTRDIVDYVLKELIREKRISPETVQDYEMSRRWKNDLTEYMKETDCGCNESKRGSSSKSFRHKLAG